MSNAQHSIGNGYDDDDDNYDVVYDSAYEPDPADPSEDSVNFGSNNADPDIIMHQPTATGNTARNPQWTYSPSGSRPLERGEFHNSMKSINSGTYNNTKEKVGAADEKRDSVCASMSSPLSSEAVHPGTSAFGSRDWSSGIFAPFRELRKPKPLSTRLGTFLRDCVCVPCMMCDIAKGLGDKVFLPFIPGTGAAIRFKVRILGGIQGSIADDCVMTSCCCPCAVCQMYREIEDIGLAPT